MVKDLTEVRSLQRKHMPDKAGSVKDVPTSLRGIAKTASLNKQHRFRDLYRMLNKAVAMILTAIYEQNFLDCSYGYRPGKGAKGAVSDLVFQFQYGVFGYVVEADIKRYFDNIDYDKLMAMLENRINDRAFLRLIAKWLKAGILEPSKTKIVRFSRFHPSRKRGKTFTFLGFEFYWFKDRKGVIRAKRRTASSKQRIALRRMRAWLKPPGICRRSISFRL